MRVLLVNQDAVVRYQFEVALRRGGFEVVSVTDPLAAWEILKRVDAPRLVVLEWEVACSDGEELLVRLRSDAGRPYVHAIVTSARAGHGDAAAAFEAGADQLLSMPADSLELRARVQAGARLLEWIQRLEARVGERGHRAA